MIRVPGCAPICRPTSLESSMSVSRLRGLLERCQQALARGVHLSAAGLCPDAPELARRLRAVLEVLADARPAKNGSRPATEEPPTLLPPPASQDEPATLAADPGLGTVD